MDQTTPTQMEAPGANAARICGILSIICAASCLCFPVGIILGIIALVQHAKSKRQVEGNPNIYRTPSQVGLITGIVGLAMAVLFALPGIGIMSAIAIPAVLGQRARSRDTATITTMKSKLPDLAEKYGRALESGAGAMVIKADLDAYLQDSVGQQKNPFNPKTPAFRTATGITAAATEEDVAAAVRRQATTLGEVVFVMSAPTDPMAPRFVAGAVRLQTPLDGDTVAHKVIRID